MNVENKQRIINNLFDNKFNLDNFKEFVANILNTKIANRSESKKIYKAFLSYITSYQIISEYSDSEKNKMYVMTVKVKEDKDPVRARVKQREFIAKLLREWHRDGALVVFYNEDSSHWRMSFIRLNYEFTMKGIEEKITPAKRLSYVVGEGEASKTAKDQFYTLANLEESVSLNKLEEVFALEKVTNEFFKEYKNKYLDIKETLINDENFMTEAKKHDNEKPESFAEGFAKKLMGQISFIYFLQKKGWLGLKMTEDKLSYEEYNKIYERALDKEKEVLEKIYDRVDRDTFVLNKEELSKLDNKTESELLARAFNLPKYFKEWGNGNKKFLRTLFENHSKKDKNNGKTFFEDYLEVLFYNNFSEDRGELQYSTEFDSRIPFLNGGLFDPYGDYKWRETKFNLKDELFSNNDETGILDIFDRYNFTINENDSYETEVAVDPEMLGKVFENLLDVSDRKSKGAFYTPREIVRYMTNESIMNYLLTNLEGKDITKDDLEYLFSLGEFTKEYDQQIFEKDYLSDNKHLEKDIFGMPRNIITNSKLIDELLVKVKIADPACGSGAFPLGILNEIVRARNVLTFYINMIEVLKEKDEKNYWKRIDKKQKERKLYKLKLETIQNCLYGVDIEPSAIDITKLRLWLSIIVDSDNNNVRPLPNLDFNFMIGNSLIDEFEGMKLFDESLLNDKVLEKEISRGKIGQQKSLLGSESIKQGILEDIFSKQARFFTEKNLENKKRLKNEIEKLEISLIKFTLEVNQNLSKLNEIEKGRRERRKPYFLWKLEFAKVFRENGGFDIILGNPPYVGEKGNKELFYPIMNSNLGKYYMGRGDLFYFFFHLGLNLLKEKGKLAFITTNYYLTADGALNLRKDLKERSYLEKLINFNEITIFDTAKGQHNLITILEKNTQNKNRFFTDTIICFEKASLKDVEEILYGVSSKAKYYKISFNNLYDGENEYIRLEKDSIIDILDRIKGRNKSLIELTNIKQGLVSGADKFTDSHKKKYDLDFEKGTGIFVLNKNEQEEINKNDRILLKSFYKNSDIKKYFSSENTNYKIIYITKETKISDYPSIEGKLMRFKKILEAKRETKLGRLPWYSLHWSREQEIFEGEKIVCPQRSYENSFAYNNIPWFSSADVYFITKKNENINLKYLLAILNSKLCYIWLYKKGKRKGDMLELYATPLEQIPIKVASSEEQEKYVQIVDRIMELKKLDKETQEFENQIDEMVYDLYELTEEEKELVREFKK